jgi:hypothetical protein
LTLKHTRRTSSIQRRRQRKKMNMITSNASERKIRKNKKKLMKIETE